MADGGASIWLPALLGIGGSVIGGLLSSNASSAATGAQVDSINKATALQAQTSQNVLDYVKQQSAQNQANQAPWLSYGRGAVATLGKLMGIQPDAAPTVPLVPSTPIAGSTGTPLIPPGPNGQDPQTGPNDPVTGGPKTDPGNPGGADPTNPPPSGPVDGAGPKTFSTGPRSLTANTIVNTTPTDPLGAVPQGPTGPAPGDTSGGGLPFVGPTQPSPTANDPTTGKPYPIAAIIPPIASAIGGYFSAGASADAAAAQAAAIDQALQLQAGTAQNVLDYLKQQSAQNQANQAPWLSYGRGAVKQLGDLMGIKPDDPGQATTTVLPRSTPIDSQTVPVTDPTPVNYAPPDPNAPPINIGGPKGPFNPTGAGPAPGTPGATTKIMWKDGSSNDVPTAQLADYQKLGAKVAT